MSEAISAFSLVFICFLILVSILFSFVSKTILLAFVSNSFFYVVSVFNFLICFKYSLGNDLVTLGSLATAGTSENPDDGQARGGQSRAVHGLEMKV